MLAYYSSYIELLAAVYTSMFIDVKSFRDLWLPKQYKEQLEAALNLHKMDGDEDLRKKVLSAMDDTIATQIKKMRCQAVTMFAFAALSLIFLGHESVLDVLKDPQLIRYYESYIVSLLAIYLVVFTFSPNFFFMRWRRVVAVVIGGMALFAVVYNMQAIPLTFCDEYSAYFAPIALVLLSIPALIRMIENRLYLKVYSKYLTLALRLENKDYELAKQSLSQHEYSLMPSRYKHKLGAKIVSSAEMVNAGDTCLQGALEFHQEKLIELAKMPNVLIMMCSVCWCWVKINAIAAWNWLRTHFSHRQVSSNNVDYKELYDLYVFAKTKNGEGYTLEMFCKEFNFDKETLMHNWAQGTKK